MYVYVPASVNTSAPESPWFRFSVPHEPSARDAVCGAESAFVQLMTSPTAAVTGSGSYVKSLISTSTVAAAPAGAGAQAAPPPSEAAGCEAAGWEAAGAVVAPPPPHAASSDREPTTRNDWMNRRMRGVLHELDGLGRAPAVAEDTPKGGERFSGGYGSAR